jgi:DNA polymerase-3 subunit delta
MQLTDKQLSAHLNKHAALPISLITGDVPLLVQEAANKIRRAAHTAGYEQRELFFIENNQDWQKVQHALENFNLFSQKSFIEIRHHKTKFDEAGISILSTFLQNLPDDKRILIITDKLTAAQQKAAWIQTIDRHGLIVTVRSINMYELPAWISERLKQVNLKADHDSIQLLAELTEGNLLATQQAIEKLHLLYPQQTIDKKAIATVATDNTNFNIFDLTNYALQGARARVIQVLQSLHFTGSETTLILWALARELRLLHELAFEKQQGKPLAQLLASQWASRKILLQKALTRLSVEKIRSLLHTAEQIDRIIKGLSPGNAWQALERLCLAMAGATI